MEDIILYIILAAMSFAVLVLTMMLAHARFTLREIHRVMKLETKAMRQKAVKGSAEDLAAYRAVCSMCERLKNIMKVKEKKENDA